MNDLRTFQESWKRSAAAPLRFTEPGVVEAPESDGDPALVGRILSFGGVSGTRRLEAYRLQYWFRLITLLQKDFPLLGGILGWEAFNPLVADYLQDHPPGRNPSDLGDAFPSWLENRGAARNWIEAAHVDLSWSQVFDAPEILRPTAEELGRIAEGKTEIVLQPSVRLLRMGRDWIPRRFELEEDSLQASLPRASRRWWILFRNGRTLRGEPVDAGFARLVEELGAGRPWEEALEASVAGKVSRARSVGRWFAQGQSWGIWGVREPA